MSHPDTSTSSLGNPNPNLNLNVTRVALGFGANLGDREATIRTAVAELAAAEECRLIDLSELIQTAPVGGPEQPYFLNAVAIFDTGLTPRRLLQLAQGVERLHGRERLIRWGPRTLDIDILSYGTLISDDPLLTLDLTLPHPRLLERLFVLLPWAQVDPDYLIPGTGLSVAAALDQLQAKLPRPQPLGFSSA